MNRPVPSRHAVHETLDADGAVVLTGADDAFDPAEMFTLRRETSDIWLLAGEVDFASAPGLRIALGRIRGRSAVVDVSGLDFIDVAGMRAIALAAAHNGVALELRGASPHLQRLWRVAGFDRSSTGVRLIP